MKKLHLVGTYMISVQSLLIKFYENGLRTSVDETFAILEMEH